MWTWTRDHRLLPWDVTPLMRAAAEGHEGVVKVLIERGADVNATDKGIATIEPGGKTALVRAVRGGHGAVVRLLLAAGARDRARARETALGAAAEEGDAKMVRAMLDAGVDVDVPDSDRETPLLSAARAGRMRVARLLLERTVRFLLDRGADPRRVDKEGKTAVEYARIQGRKKVVRMLEQGMSGQPKGGRAKRTSNVSG